MGAGARMHRVGCGLVFREEFQPWLAGTGRGFRSFQRHISACSQRFASLCLAAGDVMDVKRGSSFNLTLSAESAA